jgi:hypothetical protein
MGCLKGLGHKIIIVLKWYGLIGESLADINIIFNCPFNFYWINKFLAPQREKLLTMLKTFQN